MKTELFDKAFLNYKMSSWGSFTEVVGRLATTMAVNWQSNFFSDTAPGHDREPAILADSDIIPPVRGIAARNLRL